MQKMFILITIFILNIFFFNNSIFCAENIKEWEVFEIKLMAKNSHKNPYIEGLPDNEEGLVRVNFTGLSGKAKGMNYEIIGFWDGGQIWKVRFAPPASGEWSYISRSIDSGLNNIKGTFRCEGWTEQEKNENPIRRGFISVCKTGKRSGRYFEYSDGTPFLWIGDTWWNWTKRGINFSSFKKLADDRAQKGFNIGQLFVAANGWGRISSLLDAKFDNLDIEHMQNVEKMIEYANSKGITVWVHGWWSRENLNERASPEKMRRWWKYLIHRLGTYNVIWILAGEYNMNNYGGFGLNFWKELGKMVKEEDPYKRIVGVHPTPPTWRGGIDAPQWSTGEVLHQEDWLDYNQSQVGHGRMNNELIPDIITSEYKRKPPKPVVVTEPWYEFILGNPSDEHIRFGGWSAILSGAVGHTYGGGHVWKAHVPEAPAPKDNWPMDMSFETNTLDYPGAVSIGYMAKFFKNIKWWELEPHPELVLEYPEKYCSAVPGKEYVVYLRYGGSVKLNLKDSSSDVMFNYRWFNPRIGKYESSGKISGGNIQRFQAHDYSDNDWVLHLSVEK